MRYPTKKQAAAAVAAAVLATGLGACRVTGWNDTAGKASAATATTWLKGQQQADGGFEVAGFPGFETPDAVIAIAEDAQQQLAWDKPQALAAVQATANGSGKTPLDAIDDYADGAINAGQAAKLVTQVAVPLGLSPTAFDPQGDGAVNLVAKIDAAALPNGTYGAFGATLAAATAKKAAGGTVPANTVTAIRAAQKADGSWDFQGDPTGTGDDIDTTASALIALVSAGATSTDADVQQGLAFLAGAQQASGAWTSFGTADPNSTSMAVLAISGVGYDPATSCWRDAVAPALAGNPYGSPTAWLRSQQAGDGHIASPNDGWGVNTFATTQTIQALRRGWMPANAALKVACP